jgi:predicted transcriptional regulator
VDEACYIGVGGAVMASTTVRVSEHTHQLLRELAAATGEPLQRVLERAVEDRRRLLLEL